MRALYYSMQTVLNLQTDYKVYLQGYECSASQYADCNQSADKLQGVLDGL